MSDLPLTIQEASAALRNGDLTSVELTREYLGRIGALNETLGAFITVTAETALAEAAEADSRFAAGVDLGPLQGIPYCVKDIIATRDAPTTANSVVLDPAWGEGYDAPVVARLRAAGAVLLGKTILSEFACGLPDATKRFLTPKNPWDLERSAAGSSSGTGIAVSAGLALAGLGTDTGGSIRGPASMNGHSGIKATFGRVPKSGCVALGFSLDNIGPHARSAWDCAAMLSVLAGYDESDPFAAQVPVDDYLAALDGDVSGLRIGVPIEYFFENPGPEPETKAAVLRALDVLREAGAEVVEVAIPHAAEAKEANSITWACDAFAIHREDLISRWSDYGQFAREAITRGALFTGSDYVQAQRFRTYFQRAVAQVMRTVDVLVTPTSPGPAPLRDEIDTGTHMLGPGFTGQWNMTGQPAMAIPCGFSAETHLPLSMQIVGKPFAEATVFKVADAYQRQTSWHLEVSPIAAAIPA